MFWTFYRHVTLFLVRLFSSCDGAVVWPVLHAQAKKKKKEEAANAKLLEAEKRIKVSLEELQKQELCYCAYYMLMYKSSKCGRIFIDNETVNRDGIWIMCT